MGYVCKRLLANSTQPQILKTKMKSKSWLLLHMGSVGLTQWIEWTSRGLDHRQYSTRMVCQPQTQCRHKIRHVFMSFAPNRKNTWVWEPRMVVEMNDFIILTYVIIIAVITYIMFPWLTGDLHAFPPCSLHFSLRGQNALWWSPHARKYTNCPVNILVISVTRPSCTPNIQRPPWPKYNHQGLWAFRNNNVLGHLIKTCYTDSWGKFQMDFAGEIIASYNAEVYFSCAGCG